MAERIARTAVKQAEEIREVRGESKIPNFNEQMEKWENEEDNDADKPKYLN